MKQRHILWQTTVCTIEKRPYHSKYAITAASLWVKVYDGRYWYQQSLELLEFFTPWMQMVGLDEQGRAIIMDIWDEKQEQCITFLPDDCATKWYYSGYCNDQSLHQQIMRPLPSSDIMSQVRLGDRLEQITATSMPELRQKIVACMQSQPGVEAACSDLGLFKSKHTNQISFNFKYQPSKLLATGITTAAADPIETILQALYANARSAVNRPSGDFEDNYTAYLEGRDKLLVELKALLLDNNNY